MHITDSKSGYLMGVKPVKTYMNFAPLMHIFWFGFYLAKSPQLFIIIVLKSTIGLHLKDPLKC